MECDMVRSIGEIVNESVHEGIFMKKKLGILIINASSTPPSNQTLVIFF